ERLRELTHLILDPTAMVLEKDEPFRSGRVSLLHQFGVAVEILDGHPGRAQALDELDPADVVLAESSMTAVRSSDCGKDSDPFVVAERVGAQTGLCSDALDGSWSRHDDTLHLGVHSKSRAGARVVITHR